METPNYDIVVVDHINIFNNKSNDHSNVDLLSVSKKLHYNIMTVIYGVDDLIINKYLEIYGKYPCIYIIKDNDIERDKKRIELLVRKEKLNRIFIKK